MMTKFKKGISFKFILIFVVSLLILAQVILMPTVISRTVRENILKNTTILTQGILEQSKNYINLLLRELDYQITQVVENEKFLSYINDEGMSDNSIEQLLWKKRESNIISSFVIINIDSEKDSLLLSPITNEFIFLSDQTKIDFLNSQQAAILKENNSRTLWLGSPPTGVKEAIPSLWTYRYITIGKESFIIAGSLSREDLVQFLDEIASSSRSEVLLLSADNIAYPFDNLFFEYSFAAEALSKRTISRYNILYDTRETPNGSEQLMIQVYTDPEYFYNMIILTPQKSLLRGYNAIEKTTTLTLLILAAFSLFLSLLLIHSMNGRIKTYITAVKNITGGQYEITLLPAKILIEEDVTITKAIQEMADEIQKNKNSLKYANENLEKIISERTEELQASLNELHMTRQSLIHSEKMASLGRQGAKIAHEMNNPLSVALIASSHMGSTVNEINRKFEEGKLTKSDFISLSSTAAEVSNIIQRNLKHASEMTKRFKNFASDLSREERKTIRIGNYIKEIINSYSYKLKNTPYSLNLSCDVDLEVTTDPSIFYQIITNLINNSLLHGFEGRDFGNIAIEILKDGPDVFIIYRDDGKGISRDVITQLYKPFFTTKADKGGTGLGLNIIKDLIEKELEGTIKCISTLGEGAQFTIKFPHY